MDRICNEALLRKVTTPRAAAAHIKNGMTVGFSGFTVIGYPKVLPAELARRARRRGAGHHRNAPGATWATSWTECWPAPA